MIGTVRISAEAVASAELRLLLRLELQLQLRAAPPVRQLRLRPAMGWFTKKAKLGIVLDTPTIFAGQVVQGRVLAQIFEECKAESLQLKESSEKSL